MSKNTIYIGGAYPNKLKYYSNIFTNSSTEFKTSLNISINDDHTGGILLTLVYWDNGEKIIKHDYVAGANTTTLEIDIKSPTSIPPFILYAESTGIGAIPLTVESAYNLSVNPLNSNDNNILLENLSDNPTLSLTDVLRLDNSSVREKTLLVLDEAETVRSPLILDLDGDGVETRDLNNGVYFDHDNNQKLENSGWINKDDGFFYIATPFGVEPI